MKAFNISTEELSEDRSEVSRCGLDMVRWGPAWGYEADDRCSSGAPLSLEKIAPLKNRRGAIFSQTVIVKHSPLGDLFTIAFCKKIAPRRFLHDPLLFAR